MLLLAYVRAHVLRPLVHDCRIAATAAASRGVLLSCAAAGSAELRGTRVVFEKGPEKKRQKEGAGCLRRCVCVLAEMFVCGRKQNLPGNLCI